MSVSVAREAPGLKFRTENRPVSSRLLAENALPAIASRSRQGVAIRPKERGERKRGERAEDRDPSKRAFEARGRDPTPKDRRNLDSSRSACLVPKVAPPFSLVHSPFIRVSLELFAEDLHRGVSIP